MSKQNQLVELARTGASGGGNKNLVINGAMQVAQRGTSKTGVTNGSTGYHTIDRFRFVEGGSPTYQLTFTQSTEAPADFSNSLKYNVTTAQSSLAAGDYMSCDTIIEAQDLQHLNYGTSSAKSITLSFWVRSNVTGTYNVWFYQDDDAREATKTYTIDTADTWENKTITISGDQTGIIDNNNGRGMFIRWHLAAGTTYTSGTANKDWASAVNADRAAGLNVNMASSTSNEWYLTGVQLEVGEKATDFEHRTFADELAKCQRYFLMFKPETSTGVTHAGFMNINVRTTTAIYGVVHYPVEMRLRPSIAKSGTITIYFAATSSSMASQAISGSTKHSTELSFTISSGGSVGSGGWCRLQSGAYFSFDAEL